MVVKGMAVTLANYFKLQKALDLKIISDSVYASRNITKQNNCAFTAFISLGIFGVFQRKGSGTVKAVPSFHFHLILHYATLFRIYRNEGVFIVCAQEWRKRKINNLYRIFQITLCLCSYLIFFLDILLRKKTWFQKGLRISWKRLKKLVRMFKIYTPFTPVLKLFC